MVLVAALVVEPGGGVAHIQPLHLVGAAVALIVLCPHQEFSGAVFAQIVEQSLTVQSHPEAVVHHTQLMGGDGLKMSQPICHSVAPTEIVYCMPSDTPPQMRYKETENWSLSVYHKSQIMQWCNQDRNAGCKLLMLCKFGKL